jgi:hypothetical protein
MVLASIMLRCAMSGSSESYGATGFGRLHQTALANMPGQQGDDGLSGMLFRLCPNLPIRERSALGGAS